jgi:hypothetical protein
LEKALKNANGPNHTTAKHPKHEIKLRSEKLGGLQSGFHGPLPGARHSRAGILGNHRIIGNKIDPVAVVVSVKPLSAPEATELEIKRRLIKVSYPSFH